MTIQTKIIRKADCCQYVLITKNSVVIDVVPLEDWYELPAVKHAMELAVEATLTGNPYPF